MAISGDVQKVSMVQEIQHINIFIPSAELCCNRLRVRLARADYRDSLYIEARPDWARLGFNDALTVVWRHIADSLLQ